MKERRKKRMNGIETEKRRFRNSKKYIKIDWTQ